MSDKQSAVEAEAFLNAPFSEESEVEPDETPVASDHQETEEEEKTTDKVEETVEEEKSDETEESTEEVVKLPEDHDPDATLKEESPEEEVKEEKVPQFKVDAKNLAEKWDTLDESAQAEKLLKLQKSGRTATIKALAEELGTSSDKLLFTYTEQDKDELAQIKEELEQLKSVIPHAQKQVEIDRYMTEVQKWADHNALTPEEAKSVVGLDSEVRKAFDKLKFDPETGSQLGFKGRLKLALNQTESVQELIAAKRAGQRVKAINEGLKAKMPGAGTSRPSAENNWEELDGEALLEAQDVAAGVRRW